MKEESLMAIGAAWIAIVATIAAAPYLRILFNGELGQFVGAIYSFNFALTGVFAFLLCSPGIFLFRRGKRLRKGSDNSEHEGE